MLWQFSDIPAGILGTRGPTAVFCQSLPLPGRQRLPQELCRRVASLHGLQQGCDYAERAEQSESPAMGESKAGEVRATIPRSPWEGAAGPGLPQPMMEWGPPGIHYLPLCLFSSQGTSSLALRGVVSCCAAFSHVQMLVCSSWLGKAGNS